MRRQSILAAAILYNSLPICSAKKGRCEMKRFDDSKITSLLLAFVVGLVLTAGSVNADFTFGTPENLGLLVNGSRSEWAGTLSADGLSLSFGRGAEWLWTTRATKRDPWDPPARAWPLEASRFASVSVWAGWTTADGLEMYGWSSEPGGYGGSDIVGWTRKTITDDWGPMANLGPVVNSSADEMAPSITADGLELYFSGYWTNARPGGYGNSDLWVTKRATRNDPWGTPVNLGQTINSASQDTRPCIWADGLLLFFDSMRPGGYGQGDLYMTRRATRNDPWGQPVNLGPIVNSSAFEEFPSLSPDGSTLLFDSDRLGGYRRQDIWQVSILPIVDFNRDGTVNMKDFSKLAQYWGQNESSVDIGPTPFGDRIVDAQDLAVLAGYWLTLTSLEYPEAAAHWNLDETEGSVAHDTVGGHDGALRGEPVWQPAGGKMDGALELDGIDDYVGTDFVVNPAEGPFSVFLWVKGGEPGQAILSQAGGADWLYTLPGMGWLMTNLGQRGPLLSQTVVTDGQWHRIGFTWDGTSRLLYVDDVEVARETQTSLAGSDGGLHIGGGPNLYPGTFWCGLIDDVRITHPTRPAKPVIKPETTGFQIYWDVPPADLFYFSWASQGTLDFYSETDPIEGRYCIYCTGAIQYDAIGFDFWPDRDLTQLVQEGYSLEFWVRGDSPGARFDVWFNDTKTGEPGDRAWRMGKMIDQSLAAWDGEWQRVRIPLSSFTEFGSWDEDDGSWVNPPGGFDWAAVDYFMIGAQYHDFKGMQFWFDAISITK